MVNRTKAEKHGPESRKGSIEGQPNWPRKASQTNDIYVSPEENGSLVGEKKVCVHETETEREEKEDVGESIPYRRKENTKTGQGESCSR